MDIFRQWVGVIETDQLLGMMSALSQAITALRDKPFCTIRELEEMSKDLDINRILLQLVFE